MSFVSTFVHRQEGDAVTSRSVTPLDYGTFLSSIFDEWISADVRRRHTSTRGALTTTDPLTQRRVSEPARIRCLPIRHRLLNNSLK